MTVRTESAFDVEAYRAAVERGWDLDSLLPLYDEDAEYVTVDRDHPPSAPGVRRGRAAIGEYFSLGVEHGIVSRVTHAVAGADLAAVTFSCRYPSGIRVLANSMLELRDGRIVRHTDVQAWDTAEPGS